MHTVPENVSQANYRRSPPRYQFGEALKKWLKMGQKCEKGYQKDKILAIFSCPIYCFAGCAEPRPKPRLLCPHNRHSFMQTESESSGTPKKEQLATQLGAAQAQETDPDGQVEESKNEEENANAVHGTWEPAQQVAAEAAVPSAPQEAPSSVGKPGAKYV